MATLRDQCEYSAYNFFAGLYKIDRFSDIDSFVSAKNSLLLVERAAPQFWYCVYDIDAKKVIATVWHANSGFEFLKVGVDGMVLEHYRRHHANNIVATSHDLVTKEVIEVYKNNGDKLSKFHPETGELLGFTQTQDFEKYPDAFKTKLADFPHKHHLVYWAEKPYGNVVGVRYWISDV